MNTSLGFHTFTISKKLTTKEAEMLINDFKSYMEKTGEIAVFPIRKVRAPDDADGFTRWLYANFSQYYVLHYTKQNKGIIWLLRCNDVSPGFIKPGEIDRPCSIKATINPKILTGGSNYLAAATSADLKAAKPLFSAEAKKISPVLGTYSHYKMNRPDYCVNFDLNELGIPCTPEQMIYLIKHADIPWRYLEREKYDDISKRKKTDKNNFYLESKSVTINCYGKEAQLRKKFPDCPDLEASRNVIRFEVQCNYLKTYSLLKKVASEPGTTNSDAIQTMLSEDYCDEIIRDYFNRVIHRGDYFTLDGAIREVKRNHFQRRKEERLIGGLRRINQYRGIHRVKAALQAEELNIFRRTLSDLAEINVNPVTIPREWNIPRIPNLLDAYDRSTDEARSKKRLEEAGDEILKEYFKDRKRKSKHRNWL